MQKSATINRYAIPIFAQTVYREHRFDADIELYTKELAEFLDVALGVSPTGAVTVQRNLFQIYDDGGQMIIVADEGMVLHRLAKEFMAGFDEMHPRKPE